MMCLADICTNWVSLPGKFFCQRHWVQLPTKIKMRLNDASDGSRSKYLEAVLNEAQRHLRPTGHGKA